MKQTTRPTTAKIREAVFNILAGEIKAASFLDLFAGTGNVGIDAYLYGAESVVLVENNRSAVKEIRKNIENAGIQCNNVGAAYMQPAGITLIPQDALAYLKTTPEKFDIIYIDPPYETELGDAALEIIERKNILIPGGVIIFEHYHKKEFKRALDKLSITQQRKYGQTALTFFTRS